MLGMTFASAAPFSAGSVLAYLGPETVMPMTSLLAAAVGLLLMAWRRVVHWIGVPFAWFFPQATALDAPTPSDASGEAVPTEADDDQPAPLAESRDAGNGA